MALWFAWTKSWRIRAGYIRYGHSGRKVSAKAHPTGTSVRPCLSRRAPQSRGPREWPLARRLYGYYNESCVMRDTADAGVRDVACAWSYASRRAREVIVSIARITTLTALLVA